MRTTVLGAFCFSWVALTTLGSIPSHAMFSSYTSSTFSQGGQGGQDGRRSGPPSLPRVQERSDLLPKSEIERAPNFPSQFLGQEVLGFTDAIEAKEGRLHPGTTPKVVVGKLIDVFAPSETSKIHPFLHCEIEYCKVNGAGCGMKTRLSKSYTIYPKVEEYKDLRIGQRVKIRYNSSKEDPRNPYFFEYYGVSGILTGGIVPELSKAFIEYDAELFGEKPMRPVGDVESARSQGGRSSSGSSAASVDENGKVRAAMGTCFGTVKGLYFRDKKLGIPAYVSTIHDGLVEVEVDECRAYYLSGDPYPLKPFDAARIKYWKYTENMVVVPGAIQTRPDLADPALNRVVPTAPPSDADAPLRVSGDPAIDSNSGN